MPVSEIDVRVKLKEKLEVVVAGSICKYRGDGSYLPTPTWPRCKGQSINTYFAQNDVFLVNKLCLLFPCTS